MGDDMWRLWFTKLLLIVTLLLTITIQTRSEGEFKNIRKFVARNSTRYVKITTFTQNTGFLYSMRIYVKYTFM